MKLGTLNNSALHISCQNLAQSTEMSVVADSQPMLTVCMPTAQSWKSCWTGQDRAETRSWLSMLQQQARSQRGAGVLGQAGKPGESLILKTEKRISNLGVPASGESLALRAQKRKAQKDHKKSKRRKQKRSQSVLTSRVTPPSSREPRLVQMFKKPQSQAIPASLSATQNANDSSDVMLPQQRCAYPMW